MHIGGHMGIVFIVSTYRIERFVFRYVVRNINPKGEENV